MKRHPLTPIALTLAFAAACAPNPQAVSPNTPTPAQNIAQSSHTPRQLYPVRFKVETPAQFRTQQVEPTFARLQIDGTDGTVEIVNGDANGFIPITSETTMVEANVPAGNNIAVSLSMHLSDAPDSPPTATIGGVFHIPETATPETPQEVELSFPGELVAQLVRQLRQSSGTDFDPTVPIDFETYKSFALAILNKMPLGRQNPGSVEVTTLADLISSEALRVDQETVTQLQNAGTLKMVTGPSQRVDQTLSTASVLVTHSYPGGTMDSETNSATRLMPDGFTSTITRMTLTSEQGGADILGLDYREAENFMFSFKPATDSSSRTTNTLAHNYIPRSKTPFRFAQVGALAVGTYKQSDNNFKRTAYITEKVVNGPNTNLVLKAVNPRDPATIYWQATVVQNVQNNSYFTPVVWNSKWKDTGCGCDDQDIIYIMNGKTVYVVTQGTGAPGPTNQGVLLWQKELGTLAGGDSIEAASLSHTGKTLYVTMRNMPDEILAIQVDPYETWNNDEAQAPVNGRGYQRWSYQLPGTAGIDAAVAIGSDGTLYATTTDANLNDKTKGHVVAIDPVTGTKKWSYETIGQVTHSPVVDRPPGASTDHIYVMSTLGRLYSLNGQGQARWNEPFIFRGAMYDASSSPLIAQDAQNDRVIYASRGNGLIYAIQAPANGSAPYQLWSRTPSGSIKNNLVLQDNYLYTSTLNGGEGQVLKFHALHVHTPSIAESAPWPVGHGNQSSTGVSRRSAALRASQPNGV